VLASWTFFSVPTTPALVPLALLAFYSYYRALVWIEYLNVSTWPEDPALYSFLSARFPIKAKAAILAFMLVGWPAKLLGVKLLSLLRNQLAAHNIFIAVK